MAKEKTETQTGNKRNIDRSPEANFRKALEQIGEGAAKIYKKDSKDPRLALTDKVKADLEELIK